jgi:hypothetical protein
LPEASSFRLGAQILEPKKTKKKTTTAMNDEKRAIPKKTPSKVF